MTDFLIVDDHELVRRAIKHLLLEEWSEATFGEAGDSAGALEQLANREWDLMMLDLNIPGRSGIEVLSEARRISPRMPVLVLSGYSEEEYAVRCIRLGAAGYLTKSSAAHELVEAVKKVLLGGKYVTASLAEKLAAALSSDVEKAPHELLSGRELLVLRLVASGKTIKEIAAELSLSEKTIATYRARITQKLGLSSNVELTRYAIKNGLA